MLTVKTLENKVKNKTVGLIGAGKSVEELEKRIEDFRDTDIVWASFNFFDIMETFVLSKINKKLDIAFNAMPCIAPLVFPWVEEQIQTPWALKIINRGDLFITSQSYLDFLEKQGKFHLRDNLNKILLLENITKNGYLVQQVTGNYKTNATMVYIINALLAAEVKRIILFGFDGAVKTSSIEDIENSYYKIDVFRTRVNKQLSAVDWQTKTHNLHFEEAYKKTITEFNLSYTPELINCSPNNVYTCYKTVTFDEVKDILRKQSL